MSKLTRLICSFGLLISLLAPATMVAAQAANPDANPNALNPSDSISNICKNADPNNLPPSCAAQAQVTDQTPNPLFGPSGVLTTVINLLSLIVGIISVFVIIIAGVKFITSSGDSNTITEARNAILYAVIALAITAAAQVMVRFLLSRIST